MDLNILIVEDDPAIARLVRDNLVYDGFSVECVADGKSALKALRSCPPDLVLLDLMLPGLSGFEICRMIGEAPVHIPLIVVSAREKNSDKIRALDLGADDYITKPFSLEELLARVHALVRRSYAAPDEIDLDDVHIDFVRLHAIKGKTALSLTPREFEVLRFLSIHSNMVVNRERLLRSVWGYDEVPTTRTVDHFMARLRSKIEVDPHQPRYLHTIYGEGYRLSLHDPGGPRKLVS